MTSSVRLGIETPRNDGLRPASPGVKLAVLRLAQIKHCLALRSMLRYSSASIRLLDRRGGVQHVSEARRSIGGLECCAVSLNAFRTEEGICPVRAIDISTVGDRNLGESACCDRR